MMTDAEMREELTLLAKLYVARELLGGDWTLDELREELGQLEAAPRRRLGLHERLREAHSLHNRRGATLDELREELDLLEKIHAFHGVYGYARPEVACH